MLPLFDPQPPRQLAEIVQNALDNGANVLAANARAARVLQLAYAEQQKNSGREMWASPAIFEWKSWLNALWNDVLFSGAESPLLLTPLQEHALWRQVQHDDAQLVVSPDGLASLAQSAYALLSDYELQHARMNPWLETDAEHFRKWAKTFDQLCRDRRWASRSILESRLGLAVQAKTITLPASLLLVGFDRLTPSQERFLKYLREAGTQIEIAELPAQEHGIKTLICADDLRDEVSACAQWCRKQLETQPAKRIGVIVPDIGKVRAEAERAFRTVLMPQSLELSADAAIMPFEFSLGTPLSSVPVVKAALLLMRWMTTPLPEEDISWLLLSGFFSEHSSEIFPLAQFDFRRRDSGLLSPEASLAACIKDLARSAPSQARRFRNVLQAADENRVLTQSATYSHWSEFVEKLLPLAHWPGFRRVDSIQYQVQKRWQSLLDEMALLDFAGRSLSFANYLKALERQASETIFTPESHHAPIQILGALESSGQTLDAIWFLGADDSQWPATGRPHPLLPVYLQRQAQTPHSSAAVDTALARSVTTRIANSAPECIFSYARQNREGELRPSPLLNALFGDEKKELSTSDFRKQQKIEQPAPVRFPLDISITASEVTPWPAERSAGGADVLKEQAACPFQAFAKRRFAAKPLNRTDWGLDAAERGKILHNILENLWSPETPEAFRLISLDDLKAAIGTNRLDAILEHHIADAFRSSARDHAQDSWTQAYFESEQNRLLVRLHEWMEREAQRQPFTVEAREQRLRDVSVGELKLNLRADRIDVLPDSTHLLIDYKTSDMSVADWQGERPDEPQLPLYAVYGNVEHVSGLLFAQIRAGKTGFVGRVKNAQQQLQGDLSGSSALVNQPYDDSMRAGWQQALLHLAEEFLSGEASVDPKHGTETCKYCPLPGLCRIAETEQALDNEDGENGNE